MTEEPRDQQTQTEYDAEFRQRVKDEAAESLAKLHRAIISSARLDDAEYWQILCNVSQEVCAAWAEYHAVLAAIPVTGDIPALYQAVRESIANLSEATNTKGGRDHDPERSEEGTKPIVPEPVEPSS